eukprot:2414179-Amphidinium_carterae.1
MQCSTARSNLSTSGVCQQSDHTLAMSVRPFAVLLCTNETHHAHYHDSGLHQHDHNDEYEDEH